MDDDLGQMSHDELLEEAKKLRGGVRQYRDTNMQELCWHHPALWGLLPEKFDPIATVRGWPDFMRGCVKYHQALE